ncbi:DUF6305 family protein [Fusobacterium sp.]|uniref:DUF6305 family protein n=1 Tax=Fusobacterium sp. TaxID=68766 RepID=UPI00260E61CF|nr:DUF6305 family protein [Fusobacterium sp.]
MKKLLVLSTFLLSAITTLAANFEKPILLTSIGQSADVQMVKALLKKGQIDANFDKSVTAEGIKGEKTLILAIGGSSKGLGAAGIKAEDELARTEKLIKEAKAKGIKIIGMHIGGSARRGELSDKFMYASAPNVDYLIVVEDGNKDGAFTKISKEKNIPMDTVVKITEALEPLKNAFE